MDNSKNIIEVRTAETTDDVFSSVVQNAFGCPAEATKQCKIKSLLVTGNDDCTKYTMQLAEGREMPIYTKVHFTFFHVDHPETESKAGEVLIEFEIDMKAYNNTGKRILRNNFDSQELRSVALDCSKGSFFCKSLFGMHVEPRDGEVGSVLLTDDGVPSVFPVYRARVSMDEIKGKSPIGILNYVWLGNFIKSQEVTGAIMEAFIAQDLE